MSERNTCFIVMGFGKKTDYQSWRVLDLDKPYQYIIKPAAAVTARLTEVTEAATSLREELVGVVLSDGEAACAMGPVCPYPMVQTPTWFTAR